MEVGENRVHVFYGTEKREKEKDSRYIQKIMRENFDASPLATRHSESLATGYVTLIADH